MSTAFHPQTDGQTECMNAVMEQYLRAYVGYLQDDWTEWLPIAELAANNQISDTTKLSPFFSLCGSHPTLEVDVAPPPIATPASRDAHAMATTMEEIHDHLRVEMRRAQEVMREGADRRTLAAPVYKPGDLV